MPKERAAEKRAARALAAEHGWPYTKALRVLRETRAAVEPNCSVAAEETEPNTSRPATTPMFLEPK